MIRNFAFYIMTACMVMIGCETTNVTEAPKEPLPSAQKEDGTQPAGEPLETVSEGLVKQSPEIQTDSNWELIQAISELRNQLAAIQEDRGGETKLNDLETKINELQDSIAKGPTEGVPPSPPTPPAQKDRSDDQGRIRELEDKVAELTRRLHKQSEKGRESPPPPDKVDRQSSDDKEPSPKPPLEGPQGGPEVFVPGGPAPEITRIPADSFRSGEGFPVVTGIGTEKEAGTGSKTKEVESTEGEMVTIGPIKVLFRSPPDPFVSVCPTSGGVNIFVRGLAVLWEGIDRVRDLAIACRSPGAEVTSADFLPGVNGSREEAAARTSVHCRAGKTQIISGFSIRTGGTEGRKPVCSMRAMSREVNDLRASRNAFEYECEVSDPCGDKVDEGELVLCPEGMALVGITGKGENVSGGGSLIYGYCRAYP